MTLSKIIIVVGTLTLSAFTNATPSSNTAPDLYLGLQLVSNYVPDSPPALAHFSLVSSECHDQVRDRLLHLRFASLLDPYLTLDVFARRLRRLLTAVLAPATDWRRSYRRRLLKTIRARLTAANVAFLARRLFALIEPSPATATAFFRLLADYCGNDASPGFVLGLAVQRYASGKISASERDFLLTFVVPRYVQPSIPSWLCDLSRAERPDLDGAYLLPFVANSAQVHGMVAHDPNLLATLFQLGIVFNLEKLLWPGLSPTQLRVIAPFLAGVGLERVLPQLVRRDQLDLVAELLRHPTMIIDLSTTLSPPALYLCCRVAIRFSRRDLLDQFLALPGTTARLAHPGQIRAMIRAFSADWIPLLLLLQSNYVADTTEVEFRLHEFDAVDGHMVLLRALEQAASNRRSGLPFNHSGLPPKRVLDEGR